MADDGQRHVRVAVIGSGFGGLGAAVRLRRAGITDFVILERADSVGGTWRDNSYPGCACDVPSHLYSFSFAPNPQWPRNFSGQPHIRAYLERVTDTFGLRPHLRFNSEVRAMRWNGEELRWEIDTAAGSLTADVVVSATGPLSDPQIPDIPGLADFPGQVFHSARWDHDYDLRGKRVAMVGTGASAIQIVPAIQPEVDRLTVFQRTPPWVMPRADRRITAAERWLHTKVPATRQLRRQLLWGIRELQVGAFTKRPGELGLIESLGKSHMRKAIKDPALQARLTPDYRIGCKRILLSNAWYPALARPNVDVVTSGLREIRGNVLVATDGSEAEVDAVIFGTGFHVTDMPIAQRVTGARSTTLAEEWKDGMAALRGTSAAGFPNFLTIIGPNTGLGNSSMILMIEAQLNYLVDFMRQLDVLGDRIALDARQSAVDGWTRTIQERMQRTVWNTGGCDSWYLDASGRNTTAWPGTTSEFRRATRQVDLAEYRVLRPAQRQPDDEPPPTAGGRATAEEVVGVPPSVSWGSMKRPAHATRGRYAPPVPRRTLDVTSADGARLYAEVHGPEGAPAVVLSHGWTCSTAFWAPVVRELADTHKVVVYDQRGHGRSPAVPPAGYSTRALADDLVAVLEQSLAPGERAVVGGHSMGGMTIMAAAERPELRARAAAALLCSTGCADLAAESRVFPLPSPGGRRLAHRLLLGSRAPLGPVSPVAKWALRYATMGGGSSAEQIEACARIVHACPIDVRARWGMVLYHLQLTRGVSRLEVPTAVLAGTADRLTPFVHARRLASVLPQCEGLTELPGLGHMTPVEAPDAVAGRLRELVRDHLAGTPSSRDERPAGRQKKEKAA